MEDTSDMTGKGRGRGWLKLDKLQEPGGLQAATPHVSVVLPPEQPTAANYAAHPQYEKIVNTIAQFNADDDGILINQKFKYTVELFNKECRTEDDVKECYDYVYKRAKQDTQFINNFVEFVSLNTFKDVTVHNVKLRPLLFQSLQKDFENAAMIKMYNKVEFNNLVRVLGGYFDKGRMGILEKPICVLVLPVLSCLEMLLDDPEDEDIELFGTQISYNGAKSLEYLNQKGKKSIITDLFNKVRNLLISNLRLTETSRTWLMLSLDSYNNDFGVLPPELMNFYQNKLNNLRKTLSMLSIQTHPTHVQPLDAYASDVNVLKVDTPPPPKPQPQPQANEQQKNHYHQKKSPNFNVHKPKDDNTSEVNLNRKATGKAGRPILGAGARNNCKENAAGWDVKQKNMESCGWGDLPKRDGGVRINKGWEHDDRFDNDY